MAEAVSVWALPAGRLADTVLTPVAVPTPTVAPRAAGLLLTVTPTEVAAAQLMVMTQGIPTWRGPAMGRVVKGMTWLAPVNLGAKENWRKGL